MSCPYIPLSRSRFTRAAGPGSIAVIIPTYDHGESLRTAVLSVLAQTRRAAEIIVVSDGAPVDPATYIGDLLDRGPWCILTKTNGGAPAARDFGARHATSDYLIFLDDDDRYLPDALERLGSLLDERPDAVGAAGGTRFISRPGAPAWLPTPAPDGQYFDLLLDGAEFLGGATLIRAEAYRRAGGYVPDIRGNEDWFLNLRLARLGPFMVYPEPVIEYREHAGSFSAMLTQLDYAPEVARRIARLVGPGGQAAGNRLRIIMLKMYLDKILTGIGVDLRARRRADAARKLRRALKPLFLPWPSRSVLLTWLSIVRRHLGAPADAAAIQGTGIEENRS